MVSIVDARAMMRRLQVTEMFHKS